jgi:peptidoglycan hydrolase-like protein with peptidoglycan-binding domain
MNPRGRPLAVGAAAALVSSIVVTSAAMPSHGAPAPGSMASAITTAPVRPPTCTTTQINALEIEHCALYVSGIPSEHGFPTPPFPTESIVTAPITPEEWTPLQQGASGPIVVLLQRALRSVNPTLVDDGEFGSITASAVRAAQTAAGFEANGIVDAALAQHLGILVTATESFPGDGWIYNGNTYTGSPILVEWEARLVQGHVRADPDISPLFEGFLADLRAGSLRVDEKSAYGFRCVATSTRNCRGQTLDQLSYHAWGAAIDINWTQNPLQTVSHSSDACSADGELAMPDWVIKAAQRWGLYWGGWYGCPKSGARSITKDPHHFEYRGTPELARRIAAKNNAPSATPATVPGIADLLLNCGDRGAGVAALRAALPAGDRPDEPDSMQDTFTVALVNAVLGFQRRLGLPETGALDPATATALGLTPRHSEVFPVLHMNSCGAHVESLQVALGLTPTGTFTATTLAKLRAWQRANNLRPTGVTDTATAAALGLRLPGGSAGSGSTTTTTTASSTSSTTSTTIPVPPGAPQVTVPLASGARSDAVRVLQQALTDAGYPTPVTGYFAARTATNLRKFTVANGLKRSSTLTIEAARALGLHPVPKVPTRYGQRGEHVLLLQEALRAEGFAIAADGRFGPGTRQALRTYQAEHALKVTGYLDAATAAAFGW